MLCICDAVGTTLLLYERTKEVGVYIGCYDVIPGWDQESSLWVYSVLSRALCYILWVCTIFRQKNIRTKGHWMLECLFKRAWQTYAHSMLCICDAGSTTLLLWKRTKEVDAYNSFVSLRMQCLHCKFFCCDGHVAVQAEACLCMDWRMGIIRILMFFCSYVLITCLHPACGDMRSLVLARDDGARAVCKMASCKVKCETCLTR